MWVALGLTAAVVAAAVLYRADRSNRHMHPVLRGLLALLRAAVLAALVMLLARPALRTVEELIEPPLVVVLQDVSASVGTDHPAWADSLASLQADLQNLDAGGGPVEVAVLAFGSSAREITGLDNADTPDTLAFSDVTTNLYAGLEGVRTRWGGANLAAVILASDGRVNRGRDPEAWNAPLGAPLLAIALGDASIQSDLRIDALWHNDVAGLGNQYPIEVQIGARELSGLGGVLTLSGPGLKTQRAPFACPAAGIVPPLRLMVEASEPGLQRIQLNVKLDGPADSLDLDLANNNRIIYIDVIENRRRVLVTSRAPHPDAGALVRALSGASQYEIVQRFSGGIEGLNPGDFDVVFFLGPEQGDADAADLLNACLASHVAIGILGSPRTDWELLKSRGIGMEIQGKGALTFEPQGSANPSFPHFSVPDGLDDLLADVPPVKAPFGDIAWGARHEPLLLQRLGHLATDHPLLTCFKWGDSPAALMIGEGMWRWRMVGHLQTGSHEAFDTLWRRIVQYLTSDESVERFRIDAPRVVAEDQAIRLQARVYDATFAPALGAEVSLDLTNEEGNDFHYMFSGHPSGEATGYQLDMGLLPRGAYRWRAESPGHPPKTGGFQITPIAVETTGAAADHPFLERLTAARGGQVFSTSQRSALVAHIASLPTLVPAVTPLEQTSDLIEEKWILALLLLLLALEWMTRRWSGAY